MDPQAFTNFAENSGTPAPMWFIEFFKVLGFILHSIPMNLWYAGLIVALGLAVFGGEPARRYSARFMRQLPIIIAFGVNLGVVPLLFVQLAYYQFFYPATILMAWFWLSIMALLTFAYYGVYAYVWGLKNGKTMPGWRNAAGWGAAIFFITIGFFFANGMSLLDHISRWPDLWEKQQIGGAVLGTALNIGDPTLWPRWLMMFGLALTTSAVWILADMVIFDKDASEEYKNWAWIFAKKLYTTGTIWTIVAGSWYMFGTWSKELFSFMFSWPTVVLTLLTASATGLPWIMIVTQKRCSAKTPLIAGICLAQVGVMTLNAISRQIVQNFNIDLNVGGDYKGILSQETATQWGPLLMFLMVFVFGLVVVAWMIKRVVIETAQTPKPS